MIDVNKKPIVVLVGLFLLFWTGFALQKSFKQKNQLRDDFSGIVKRGVLRVCGEYDLFSYYSDNSGLHGFHYEIAESFADKLNLKLEYHTESDFKRRLKMLRSGRYDIITGPLPVIAELKSQLLYTTPIYRSRLMLVQRKNPGNLNLIRNQVSLSRKLIYVSVGSPYISRLHNLGDEIGDSISIREIPVTSNEQLIALVSSKFCDFAVCDERVVNAYLNRFKQIDAETPVSFNQFHAWAVDKMNIELLDSLDVFISGYKKSPEFSRLSKRYLIDK